MRVVRMYCRSGAECTITAVLKAFNMKVPVPVGVHAIRQIEAASYDQCSNAPSVTHACSVYVILLRYAARRRAMAGIC